MTRALSLAVSLAIFCWTTSGQAQEKSKDDLDRLLEKLEKKEKDDPKAPAPKDEKKVEKKDDKEKSKPAEKAKDEPAAKKAGDLSTKDKDLDGLLEKLGGTGDAPETKKERPKPSSAGDSPMPPKPGDAKKDPLRDDQRKLDDVLEERAGKIKKKPQQQQEDDSSPLGEAIKQMRDVEKRLGKTDTGEDTRKEQQEIVKKLETILKEMRKNQQGQRGQQRRMVRADQTGNQPGGQQQGSEGANARGVGPQKPARPSVRDVLTDDKNPWGNLPPALKEELANVFKEQGLKNKEGLIERYFISVSKKSVPTKGN
jgi:hypothetical protein